MSGRTEQVYFILRTLNSLLSTLYSLLFSIVSSLLYEPGGAQAPSTLKFIFISILVIWLAFKLAGFFIRFFLRSAGYTVLKSGQPKQEQTSRGMRNPFGPTRTQPAKPNMTDKLGDYVDFEEIKDKK